MDRWLQETILRGDSQSFHRLVQENERIITQTVAGSQNTVLHLAARFGRVELAAEIVKLLPEMVAAENEKMETPLHEACREGHMEIVRVLVGTNPWTVNKVNREGESGLFVACERGRVDVVKHLLLNYPQMLMLEMDALTTSLHVAASAGHTEVAKEVLKVRPDFAWKKDQRHGFTPLHISCMKGHLDITRELLRLDNDLSSLQDNDGRTPLHWAAIKGRVNILDEILSENLEPAEMITEHGETVLHLAVKNNHYDAVRYLADNINTSKLVNLPDHDGNTVLHLATAGKLNTMVGYLLKLGVDVNALNRKGYTALDVVETSGGSSGSLMIFPALREAGAKRCDELLPGATPDIQQIQDNSPKINSPISWPKRSVETPTQNHRRRHRRRREKQLEIQNEGLRNARNTITVVAVLIATVTFAAGINPPGGFNQTTGKSIMGRETSFKVFTVCNIVALFLSLGIVIFLLSIIPFRRKPMMILLSVTHKVMWVSTSFMAAAYIAATWTILPGGWGSVWVLVAVVSIGGGCTLAIFVGLGVILARHLLRKWEWRKKNAKDVSPRSNISRVEEMRVMRKGTQESTSNSDLDSSDQGYHPF
ncbi:hypothetical protein SLE2022_036240 [Rubroshorea leprosula]